MSSLQSSILSPPSKGSDAPRHSVDDCRSEAERWKVLVCTFLEGSTHMEDVDELVTLHQHYRTAAVSSLDAYDAAMSAWENADAELQRTKVRKDRCVAEYERFHVSVETLITKALQIARERSTTV